MRPDTFTITTFWLDWLLMPILLAGAWLTARWALSDSRQAKDPEIGGKSFVPAWAFSIPLFIAAAAWVIAGSGTLIKEDYWEMRVIFAAFLLWTVCCMAGAILLILSFLRRGKRPGTAGVFNLIGLALISVLMILPGLIDHSSPAKVTMTGHVWFFLLAVSVGLLTAGMLMGFPYKFPRFPLGLGGLFFIGWGLSEVAFRQASFPWLVRIWKLNLGMEYLEAFPLSDGWRIAGIVKFIVGIGTVAILVIASFRRRTKKAPE
ncbi:MAG: hypothetical protein JXQ30_06310 [Spirochaetes bacterium]|nr:hypothetical protein [Spirochaetota bacterium]